MVLAAGADVAHGQAHEVAHDGGVGDARRRSAHENFHTGIVLADEVHQPLLHVGADLRGGEGQAVVAVDGAFNAAGPGEGLVRAEEHRADGEQVVGDGLFTGHVQDSFLMFRRERRPGVWRTFPLRIRSFPESEASWPQRSRATGSARRPTPSRRKPGGEPAGPER